MVKLVRRKLNFVSIVLLSILPVAGLHAGTGQSADVIVYGSTPGGFCAAIGAAREGATVILLEPTTHIGGLSTGGLSHCDSNQMHRASVMGLFHEWHQLIVQDYLDRGKVAPYNPNKKDHSRWTFEPHVAMRVTKQMLEKSGVTVLTGQRIKSVIKVNNRIKAVVTVDGTFSGKTYVDGTYEGDLMAAAGVEWTIGREGRNEFGESLAGKQFTKTVMDIDGFDENGKPLPLVTSTMTGPEEEGDRKVMAYSFRLCVTRDPSNRVPFPQPDNYDPIRFELVRRYFAAGGDKVGFDLYPLPGGKFDGNNTIGRNFSLALVGGGNGWSEGDDSDRQAIWEAHRQYTLEFIFFILNDPSVPPNIRERYAELGLCKDEFVQSNHFPPALYIREGRRMKGMYVLSEHDIVGESLQNDPIAVASFPVDSHDCQRIALKDGGVVNEGTIFPLRKPGFRRGYAYQVPYRSILPQQGQCDNLLVPVALSCTHVAISSLRIEGTWMTIGQSAGIAAALSAQTGTPVQELPYDQLKQRLLAQNQVLELPVD